MPREKLTCDCGGELTRPLPKHCPHCGAEFVGYRRSIWNWLLPVLSVVGLFVALIGALYFFLQSG